MQSDVPGMQGRWGLLLLIVVCSLGGLAGAWEEHADVLVLDFIGFRDQGAEHGRTFQETVLPQAQVVSIGIHGIIPDAWRKDAGYDAIIRAGSAKDYAPSVNQVARLLTQPQTILAFDFNEHGLPNQVRLVKPLTPNKISHPAMVAAQVAERWLTEHPNGYLILRGHSDGTYAERYIFDYLKERGRSPAAVILESPRQRYGGWVDRAKATSETLFLSITATDDLPRATLIDRGYAHVPSTHQTKLQNWVNLHVQGWRNPFAAHSIVTAYDDRTLKIQKTAASGRNVLENVPLGDLIRAELVQFATRNTPRSSDASRLPQALPLGEERKKGFPPDPPDQGGGGAAASGMGRNVPGAGGRGFPSVPSPHPRGGIAADIRITPQDFQHTERRKP